MQPQIKIGRLAGIDIGLHYSWLIIALLITLSLRAHFHDINPHWSPGTIWSAALLTGILFFVSIVVHELGHALVAKAHRLPVQSITLFALGNSDWSTRLAARVGQGVGFLFILIGVWEFFSGGGFGSLWLTLIGWFLLDAAGVSYANVEMIAGLRGLRVKDIMTDDCARVDGRATLQTFADEHLLRTWRRCFIVEEAGKIVGLVTPSDVKQIERSRWPTTPVHAVMRPLDRLRTVTPGTPLVEALQAMGREDVNQLPVVSNQQLQGILSRSHILQVLQSRTELSM